MTDHQNKRQNSIRRNRCQTARQNVEISCQACVKHSESSVQKYKLIS